MGRALEQHHTYRRRDPRGGHKPTSNRFEQQRSRRSLKSCSPGEWFLRRLSGRHQFCTTFRLDLWLSEEVILTHLEIQRSRTDREMILLHISSLEDLLLVEELELWSHQKPFLDLLVTWLKYFFYYSKVDSRNLFAY